MEMAQKDPWFWRDGRAHVRARDMDWAPFTYCDGHELEKIKILDIMAVRYTLARYQYHGWKTVFGEFIYQGNYCKVLTFSGAVEKMNGGKEILQQIEREIQDDRNRNIRYGMEEDRDKDGDAYEDVHGEDIVAGIEALGINSKKNASLR
ncbi:hypothetical protein AOQ84DRAFT_386523 [Glonium stellatum]|uniref:Uncharacterized protein n=1 Tax=Glonium stellatum TaxID=574774 RepID=A0A8E2F791_9PEZI|nr:hypothetical protein AOQ84DRAFT_386523 [Glonium stellatum]